MFSFRSALIIAPTLLFAGIAFGQSGPTLIGAGYGPPSRIVIAPGQVITFRLTGMKVIPSAPVRATLPLPTTLADISVSLHQVRRASSWTSAVPILSLDQTNACADFLSNAPECLITGITVVIPSDLESDPYYNQLSTTVEVSQSGVPSQSFIVDAVPDAVHVLKNCPGCPAAVTHADGTLVTAATPAREGEVVVIYAVGLGAMNAIFVNFDFRPNAGPTYPSNFRPVSAGGTAIAPEFVGLTPGEVGLYQINVKLPGKFPAVPECSSNPISSPVLSNLTITVASTPIGVSSGSFDGAAICVEPRQ